MRIRVIQCSFCVLLLAILGCSSPKADDTYLYYSLLLKSTLARDLWLNENVLHATDRDKYTDNVVFSLKKKFEKMSKEDKETLSYLIHTKCCPDAGFSLSLYESIDIYESFIKENMSTINNEHLTKYLLLKK